MRNFTLTLFCLLTLSIYAQNKNPNYTSIKIERYKNSAAVMPTFVPLEIGAIKPTGWILNWAKSAAGGITGHLDEYVDVYKNGWKGFGFKARGVNEDGTGWPLEQCSYWLDGAVKLAYMLNDTMLIRKTSERLNYVVNGVLNGGETFIYWKPGNIVNDSFNNWGHALMGRALVSYYQATHNPKILEALVNVYKKFHLLPKAEEFMRLNRGTTNIDAMTETYLSSGNKAILDSIVAYSKKEVTNSTVNYWNSLNTNFVPEKGYNGAHGVSFYEIMRVPAMMYNWTGNNQQLAASKNVLQWGETSSLLPLGVCSSEEYLAGKGSIRHIETCNVPTSMWSFLWMLRVSGESIWSDKVEKIFFNAGPAPVSRDFKTMCYYQSPNRFSNKLPEVVPVPGNGDLDFTDHGHEVLCCVGNVNNTIPDYVSGMWMATMDGGLAATLYGPCSLSQKIGNKQVNINCETAYPYSEDIAMTLKIAADIKMPLYFRVPNWCKQFSIKINGRAIAVNAENGFVKIDRIWKNNDKIRLKLPMTLNVEKGTENAYPQITYFLKGDFGCGPQKAATNSSVNNPYACINYGPLLFALPIADKDENHDLGSTAYNFALDNTPTLLREANMQKKNSDSTWNWYSNEAPLQLTVPAKQFNWTPETMQPLPSSTIKSSRKSSIVLVPYAFTRFRVTMFPMAE